MDPHDAAPTAVAFELVDINAVAVRLGVSNVTVRKWRTKGAMPAPDFELANPVWRWSTIRTWAIETGRI
jgi:hypothetical protein